MSTNPPEQVEYESSVNIQSFLTFLVAMTVGLLIAVLVLPAWLPNMSFSLGGDAPKAYWYLSRATAFVALSLLWLSMALGLGITNKMARLWPGVPATFALHEYVSLLGLAFSIFHALVLLGDRAFVDTIVLSLPSRTLGTRSRSYLQEMGPAILPELYPYLNDPEADIRAILCDLLAQIGDPSAVDHLKPLINDPSTSVADRANRAVERLKRAGTSR